MVLDPITNKPVRTRWMYDLEGGQKVRQTRGRGASRSIIYPPAPHKSHPGPDTRGGWGRGGGGAKGGAGAGATAQGQFGHSGSLQPPTRPPAHPPTRPPAHPPRRAPAPAPPVGLKDTPPAEALQVTYDPRTDFAAATVGKLPVRGVRAYGSCAAASSSPAAAGSGGWPRGAGGLGFAASALLARRGPVGGWPAARVRQAGGRGLATLVACGSSGGGGAGAAGSSGGGSGARTSSVHAAWWRVLRRALQQ
jgi:hypothetical protein